MFCQIIVFLYKKGLFLFVEREFEARLKKCNSLKIKRL